jgi:hypothetical protein
VRICGLRIDSRSVELPATNEIPMTDPDLGWAAPANSRSAEGAVHSTAFSALVLANPRDSKTRKIRASLLQRSKQRILTAAQKNRHRRS